MKSSRMKSKIAKFTSYCVVRCDFNFLNEGFKFEVELYREHNAANDKVRGRRIWTGISTEREEVLI